MKSKIVILILFVCCLGLALILAQKTRGPLEIQPGAGILLKDDGDFKNSIEKLPAINGSQLQSSEKEPKEPDSQNLPPVSPNIDTCTENSECNENHYCFFSEQKCTGLGTCLELPEECADIYEPVCGCDNRQYDNSCQAQRGSVAVKKQGSCPCEDTTECSELEFCRKTIGDCVGLGECVMRPQNCLLLDQPVCGCDNITYENACNAEKAGVTVAEAGKCL